MSKYMMFDFECSACGSKFEELVKPTTHKSKCPHCFSGADRLISSPKINYRVMGVDADFPTAGDKWAKMQEQRKRVEKERSL